MRLPVLFTWTTREEATRLTFIIFVWTFPETIANATRDFRLKSADISLADPFGVHYLG